MNQAIILAAGYGNRMRPLTDDTHKTLLTVNKVPIINRIIDGLLENNIDDIIIGTGYLADKLKEHLINEYPNVNFIFVDNPDYRITNNIYSLSLIFNSISIDDDILLIESDLIYDASMIKRIINSSYENVALVDKYKTGMDGTVVQISGDIISNIIPPHLQTENFDFTDKYKTLNIYKFSKEFCNTSFTHLLDYYTKVIDQNSYYELILGILIYIQKANIYAEIVDNESWAEIDDPNDFHQANFLFSKEKANLLEETFGGYWHYDIIDFCFIRNMYFPNNSIISEIRNNITKLIHNYGSQQNILNKKLSYFLKCEYSNVILLNGASQIYPIIKHYFKGKKVLIPVPTFGEYERVFDNKSYYNDDGEFNRSLLDKEIGNNDIVVFVNPNNPTGTTIETEIIYNYARNNQNVSFIVDESFIEFSGQPSIINLLKEDNLNNVFVIKSLSKNLGIPGMRLGYTYSCNKKYINYISENIPIWNINSIGEYYLETILKHNTSLENSYKKTIGDREDFIQKLKELIFIDYIFPSGANFILLRIKEFPSFDLINMLLSKYSIYVKDISNKFNDEMFYLRIAVRTPSENNLLIKALTEIF